MAAAINSLKKVWHHPYNQQHPLDAFLRVSKWCMMKKIIKQDYVADFWGYKINMWRDSAQSRFLAFFSHLDWEEFNFMKNYLRKNDTVFDVGANIGLYTLWMVNCAGSSIQVTSFEPDEKNYSRLVTDIGLNNLTNVTIEKLALSNSTGKLNFTAGKDVWNHIVFQPEHKQSGYEVDAVTLDQYCETKGITHIAMLKIDIEGAEYYAFQGAEKTLQAGMIDVILFEINYTIRRYNLKSAQVCNLLAKHGYYLYTYQVDKNEISKFEGEVNEDEQMNYFAVRDISKVSNRLDSIPMLS
jgi:FkbM family methyltransferase